MKPKIQYFKQQTNYSCGAAVVRSILASLNVKKSEKEISRLLFTNKQRGTYTKNLINLIKELKLKYKTKSNSSISELKKFLNQDYLIILLYYLEKDKTDHYAIIKNISKDKIYLLDPYLGPDTSYKITEFNKIWHSDKRFEHKNKWFLAIKI